MTSAKSTIDYDLHHRIQTGILEYKYKGIATYKYPFDLAIYTQLLFDPKPATIVEPGSNKGGSALWLADAKEDFNLGETKIYTLGIEYMHDHVDPRASLIQCGAGDIRTSLSDELIASWKHPLFFSDDTRHQFRHCLNTLEFFDSVSEIRNCTAVEDGIATAVGMDGAVRRRSSPGYPGVSGTQGRRLSGGPGPLRLLRKERHLKHRRLYQEGRKAVRASSPRPGGIRAATWQ